MENYDIEKNRIDNEFAHLWNAIEENLPKSREMEAIGRGKIARAVKIGYINFRQSLLKSKQEVIEKVKFTIYDGDIKREVIGLEDLTSTLTSSLNKPSNFVYIQEKM